MWRHWASCKHCGLETGWNENREVSEEEIFSHLRESHAIIRPLHPDDY